MKQIVLLVALRAVAAYKEGIKAFLDGADEPTRKLHWTVYRQLNGLVKAWRTYRAEKQIVGRRDEPTA